MKQDYKGGGFIEAPLHEKSWLFMGGNMPAYPVINPTGIYDYEVTGEKQATNYTDPWTCVFESITKQIAVLLGWKAKTDPGILKILQDLKCIDEFGKINFSARFSAWMSGMRHSGVGTTYERALDSMRKVGLLGENNWPTTDDLTEGEYFADPGQDNKDLALKFLDWFTLNYEYIVRDFMKSYSTAEQIAEAAKYGTIAGCVDGQYDYDENGLIGYEGKVLRYNHSVGYVDKPSWYDILDSYEPFKKRFVPDYKIGYPVILYCNSKKKAMKLIKVKGKPAVYVYSELSDRYFPIGDGESLKADGTPEITGGDLVHLFSGTNYPAIESVDSIDETKIGKEIKQYNS